MTDWIIQEWQLETLLITGYEMMKIHNLFSRRKMVLNCTSQVSLLSLRRAKTKGRARDIPQRGQRRSPRQDTQVHLQWHSGLISASTETHSGGGQEPSG